MCVIISKDIGVELPSKEIFRACWNSNPDGAGVMFNNEDGMVEVHKGFMNFDSLWEFMEYLDKRLDTYNTSIVIHFRIGTSGKKCAYTCHPYPISNKDDELRNLDYCTEVAVAHNGIMRDYEGLNSVLNDTQIFIKNVLYPISKIDSDFVNKQEGKDLIFNITNRGRCNRFVFLEGNGNITRIGDWKCSKGIYYSNLDYMHI